MHIIRHGQLQGADRGDMLSQPTVSAELFDVAMSATPHEEVVQLPTSFCKRLSRCIRDHIILTMIAISPGKPIARRDNGGPSTQAPAPATPHHGRAPAPPGRGRSHAEWCR
jgi:hypothetical protein